MSYTKLHDVGGIQWPCTAAAPEGTERLYADAQFPSDPAVCETYGHDLAVGAPVGEQAYRALRPDGRALLKGIDYEPGYEQPDEAYPFRLTTGRTVYHWHTRTKTRRSRPLNDAAPAMWVEISAPDAAALGIAEGDIVRVSSRRGSVEAPARVSYIRPGVIFAPWHYGDDAGGGTGGGHTAANDLTLNAWDPVSKQPEFKLAAVRVERVAAGTGPAPAPTTTASAPVDPSVGRG
jgi:anaerobic selenocysteine-containing dehydrogenase